MFYLLAERRFLPYFLTQFLGAFNDNVYKNAMIALMTYNAAYATSLSAPIMVSLAAALFILPYFLWSTIAGQLADKYEKSSLIRKLKWTELVIILLGVAAFPLGNAWVLLAVLFLLGSQAAFYSPVKYSILPEHLNDDELLSGNGLVEAGTFLAILLGTITGVLVVLSDGGILLTSILVIGVSIAGVIASRFIPSTVAAEPHLVLQRDFLTGTWRTVNFTRHSPLVFRAVMGISWFWFIGSVFLTQFPAYAKLYFHADEQVVTLFLMTFSVGIACGSLGVRALLGSHISAAYNGWMVLIMSLMMFGIFLLSPEQQFPGDVALTGASEFLAVPKHLILLAMFFGLAVAAGMYAVPLFTLMQTRTPVMMRARVIAGSNILDSIFMVGASAFTIGLLSLKLGIAEVFAILGVLNLGCYFWMRGLDRLDHA